MALAMIFVRSVPPLIAAYPVNQLFLGIVVVPIVGSVAEHHVALRAAWRNRMDVAIEILTDSSTQIALLVAPLLVYLSLMLGNPMDLVFGTLELAAISAAAAVATLVAHDGKTTWLEGMMLMAVFALMGLAFFWWPV
jgi:Ca2+:H+ antiporter